MPVLKVVFVSSLLHPANLRVVHRFNCAVALLLLYNLFAHFTLPVELIFEIRWIWVVLDAKLDHILHFSRFPIREATRDVRDPV